MLRFLVMGNVRRGQLYPLCVGAERVMQAQTIAHMARKLGTSSIAHGCTAAGNDQVRFEVALRTLAPDLEIIAPVRDRAFKRQEELEYLQQRQLPVPPYGAAYSTNRGLWGVTIGGTETLTSQGSIPESAWVLSKGAFDQPALPQHHTLRFERGPADGLKPYVRVRGELWGLVKRVLFYDLVAIGVCEPWRGEDWFGVRSSGVFFPMCRASEIEGL